MPSQTSYYVYFTCMEPRNLKSKNTTLDDVARAADVSAITVSRAIRKPQMVSEKVRERVLAAIDRLGYVPDAAASALASKRTDMIGFLVPSLTNNVFADVLRGVYDACDNTPYNVQIANFRYSPLDEERMIRTFLRQKPAGLIVTGFDQTAEAKALLEAADCRIVQIMDSQDDPVDLVIGFSHYTSAADAARHLIEQGYRRPGFIGARMDPRAQRRLTGFTDVMKEAGLFDPRRVVTTPAASSIGMGTQLFADLIAKKPDTDAIFCNNDDLAAGVLLEAQRRNLDVPGQLGICGFNDLEFSAHFNPGLTSVATPRYETGHRAFEILQQAIESPDDQLDGKINLPVRLVERGSTQRENSSSIR